MKIWPLFWRRALAALHVSLSASWLGAAICLVLLAVPGPDLVGEGIVGTTYCMVLIDDYVIIPTATAVVFTGIGYGFYTQWGFIRFDWVIVKWLATLLFIAFGAFFLGPWIEEMAALSRAAGAEAFTDPRYVASRSKVIGWGATQIGALVVLVFISFYKPWGRRKKAAPAPAKAAK